MLAEIFMVRLEMQRHVAAGASTAPTSSDTRFVPITLPREPARTQN